MNKPLTVPEANAIQADWMALQPDAPEVEKQRIFRLMERLPASHFSIDSHGRAQAFLRGQPLHAFPLPVAECIAQFPTVQRSLVWYCRGEWGTLPV